MGRDNKVQSVSRAIELLQLIAGRSAGVTVGQLAELSGLHKSTVSRLVLTLEAAEAVQRVSGGAAVQIAPAFARRFTYQYHPADLQTVAHPYVQALSDRFGEAAALAVPEYDQAVFVNQVTPNLAIQVKDWTGSRFPLHTVSPGKLFLAYWSAAEQERYLNRPLAAYTANTATDPAQLRQSFAEIQETGVSWIFDEFADGLSGVSAPIVDQQQEIIGALVVYAPSYRFPELDKIEEINLTMLDFAARCSAEIQSQTAAHP